MNRPRRPAGSRNAPVSSTIQGALEDANSEIEALYSEMEEWASSLESNSMEHLPKYDEVEEARQYLETPKDTLESFELPDGIGDISLSYTQDTRRSAGSRSGRLSNATTAMDAALEEMTRIIDELTEKRDELQEARDELDNVSFPGMY